MKQEVAKVECPALPCRLMAGGMVIGCKPGLEYVSEATHIPPGSKLYVFSDGVYEVKQPNGKMWTLDGFIEVLAQPSQPGVADVERILGRVRQVQQKEQFDDDFSLLQLTF